MELSSVLSDESAKNMDLKVYFVACVVPHDVPDKRGRAVAEEA